MSRSVLRAVFAAVGLMAASSTMALAQSASGQPSWSGLYFGASYGLASTNFKGAYVTPPAGDRHDAAGNSQIRSGFVGLQHQWGNFLLGAEVNYGGTGFGDDWDARSIGPTAGCINSLTGLINVQCRARLDSTWTVGPRIGYAPNSQWLFFATGGYASARIDTSILNRTTQSEFGRSSTQHSGWFVGGGLEYNYSANMSVGLEYQHLSFDTERHFDSTQGGCCKAGTLTRDMTADADIIRLRTTFKFNRPEPVAEPMK